MEKLKPCPFCGSQPTIEPWHGGAKTKKMISCSNEDCDVSPSVTGETEAEAVAAWNTRAHSAPPVSAPSDEEMPQSQTVMILKQILADRLPFTILEDRAIRNAIARLTAVERSLPSREGEGKSPRDYKRLVGMAICNGQLLLRSRYKGMVLWSLVTDLFAVGSTTASEICREVGEDPSKKIGIAPQTGREK